MAAEKPRNINQRGRDLEEVLWRYQTTLKPMHQQFIVPIKEFAEIIIPTIRPNNVAVDIVQTIIKED
jgi:uridine kinase